MILSPIRTPATVSRLLAFIGGGFLGCLAALWIAGQFTAATGIMPWLAVLLACLTWPLGFWTAATPWLLRGLVLISSVVIPLLALIALIAILCSIGPNCM